jgi:ABC-2 type transport system ATP-binding protein
MESVEELCENISLVNNAKIVLEGNVNDIRNAHNSNKFRVKSSSLLAECKGFAVIEKTAKQSSCFECVIQKSPEMTNNQLIATLLQQTQIVSFEELLPSMNDIFIETVTKS